jgi:hypothetical protein
MTERCHTPRGSPGAAWRSGRAQVSPARSTPLTECRFSKYSARRSPRPQSSRGTFLFEFDSTSIFLSFPVPAIGEEEEEIRE